VKRGTDDCRKKERGHQDGRGTLEGKEGCLSGKIRRVGIAKKEKGHLNGRAHDRPFERIRIWKKATPLKGTSRRGGEDMSWSKKVNNGKRVVPSSGKGEEE